jgi:hypothetical protein
LLGWIQPIPRPPPPPSRPHSPPYGPIAGPLPRAQPPHSPPSLSLTSRPHLPAAPSRVLPLAGRLAPPVSRFVVLLAYDAPPSPPSPSPPSPSPRPSPRRTGEFGTAPSSPLDRVLSRYHPRREVSSSPLCGINAGAVHLIGARRAPPLPFPRAPIKRSPRAPPSPHRPQPPLSSPRPSSIREAPSSSPSPVSPSLSSPSPSGLHSKKLARPISFAPPPRVWNATPLPQSPPEAHRRRLSPRSSATTPRTTPSQPPLAKLSPPLGSPAPPRAKAPTCCPRTGSPAANHRRAHRRRRGQPVHPTVNR